MGRGNTLRQIGTKCNRAIENFGEGYLRLTVAKVPENSCEKAAYDISKWNGVKACSDEELCEMATICTLGNANGGQLMYKEKNSYLKLRIETKL